MRWQEGYVTLIWTIGPYFSAIMKLHASWLQSFPSFTFGCCHYLFWVFPELTEHTCWLHPLSTVWTGWGWLFELDEGGQLASHRSHLIATISLVHAVSKLYSCNRGMGLVTYLLVATVLLHAQTLAFYSCIVAAGAGGFWIGGLAPLC